MNFVYTYSPVWLLLIFFLAALIAFWLYRGDKVLGSQHPWLPRILALFRFVSLSMIAFFLLEPLIKKEEREIQRPIVAIAVDNSESILNGSDSLFYKNELAPAINKLIDQLDESYEVELFSFDEELNKEANYDYSGKVSNLSNLLSAFETRYYNRNLGAMVLLSDGNYNQGINPVYHPVSLNAPIYAVLLGDTGSINDLAINEVISNSISFLGDEFPIEINLGSEGMKGSRMTLAIYTNGKKVFEKQDKIDEENWFKSFSLSLPADKVGVQRYTIKVNCDSEESILQNNSVDFYINILDERLKIAIISSTPHPDIATWSNALKKNKNYEVDVFEADKFNKNISDYSLFILYQVPSKLNQTALFDQIKIAKVPYLVQVGLNSNINLLNQVLSGDYKIDAESNVEENFKVQLNKNFSLFTVNKALFDHSRNFPPLDAPLINLKSEQPYQKLMSKKIGQLDTDLPIWVVSESASPKNGVIIGEGIWRWSINSYLAFENHDVFDDFLQQTVKYLIRKGGNDRFDVDVNTEFYEGSRIKMNAKLLDPSMEIAKGGDIELTLINSDNENFTYAFVETQNNYILDLGALSAGDYSYKASAKLANETLYENGKFTVMKRMLEQKDNRANAGLMYQWADQSGGQLIYPDQLDDIGNSLLEKKLSSISYQTEQFLDMIRISWLLFVIVLFLSVEWFLRRFYGSY